MKAAEFEYVKPASLDQVFSILEEYGDEARLLAGGQTLIPTLNMRLSDPSLIVDITGIEGLRGVELQGDVLKIGALTTHTEIEESELISKHCPLLKEAVSHIAHRAIRNSGTWGGSIAYADPAAEWPTCLLALGGTVVVQGPNGVRRIAADDFFLDLYTTALEPNEVIIASDIPLKQVNPWYGFSELARRHGDYAIVGIASTASRTQVGLKDARIVLLGIGATPIRARKAEALLDGQPLNDELIRRVVDCLKAEIDPIPDLTNSAETKKHLSGVLLERILRSAKA
jgi:carbon-monoxide dehydrogenase medium subunit